MSKFSATTGGIQWNATARTQNPIVNQRRAVSFDEFPVPKNRISVHNIHAVTAVRLLGNCNQHVPSIRPHKTPKTVRNREKIVCRPGCSPLRHAMEVKELAMILFSSDKKSLPIPSGIGRLNA